MRTTYVVRQPGGLYLMIVDPISGCAVWTTYRREAQEFASLTAATLSAELLAVPSPYYRIEPVEAV